MQKEQAAKRARKSTARLFLHHAGGVGGEFRVLWMGKLVPCGAKTSLGGFSPG